MRRRVAVLAILAFFALTVPAEAAWVVTKTTTPLRWIQIGGKLRPCRTGHVTITHPGVYTWWVKQNVTACLGTRPLRISYQRHSIGWALGPGVQMKNARYYSATLGCVGCQRYGRINEWAIRGGTITWFPRIKMVFYIAPWAPGRGRLAYSSSVSCDHCGIRA